MYSTTSERILTAEDDEAQSDHVGFSQLLFCVHLKTV